MSKNGKSPPCESSQRPARLLRMETDSCKLDTGVAKPENETENKRQKLEHSPSSDSLSRHCKNAVEKCVSDEEQSRSEQLADSKLHPKFGVALVCGQRRDMEDAVAVHPSFSQREDGLHYFGLYDGHGCSHVAMKCRDRLHELVKEEFESGGGSTNWPIAMARSFFRMDREVPVRDGDVSLANCGCHLQPPACDTVGSTAVVSIVTPNQIIVTNCGDSRAVLSCNGNSIPLSIDHKPDRPDELRRIHAAGGRVINWNGARVEGVLAMSRAIGDDYLKPYVICQPEVTIIDRTAGDEFLILASDGLWDVVTNQMACDAARACLSRRGAAITAGRSLFLPEDAVGGEISDQACSEASMVLARMALANKTTDNVSVVVINLKQS